MGWAVQLQAAWWVHSADDEPWVSVRGPRQAGMKKVMMVMIVVMMICVMILVMIF